MLIVEAGNNDFHDDLRGRLILLGEVAATVEIMFINGLSARQTISTNGELYCLEHCRFAGVIVAEENRGPLKVEIGKTNSAKIFDVNSDNSHQAFPLIGTHFRIYSINRLWLPLSRLPEIT